MLDNKYRVDPAEAASARLYGKLKARLEVGDQEQARLITLVSNLVIRDKLVAPNGMVFSPSTQGNSLDVSYVGDDRTYTIHRHALTQIASKVNMPLVFVNMLQKASKENWRIDLLSLNLNTLFRQTEFQDRQGNPRFLHRIVGTELRGFLSRRFNRHLASAPLLRAYMESCSVAGAFPFDATASDVKIALKCMLPTVFEPVKGQFVCLGVEWANSDFGAGRMQVAMTVWMPTGDRFTVLDHVISRVHIGSVIEDSDIELSEETAHKEAEAQCSAINDAVTRQLSAVSVDRLLEAIKQAHEEEIPWDKLKTMISRFASKSDVETLQNMLEEKSQDLPPVKFNGEELVPTKWWASAALAFLANRTEDPEKRFDLQHAAGSFIEVANE